MCRKVRSQGIQRLLDEIFIGDVWRARAKTRKPRRALPVVGKQAVDISADHPAISSDRTLGRTIGGLREWLRAIFSVRHARVHFIAGKRSSIAGRSGHRFEALVV